MNPGLSKEDLKRAKQIERERRRRKKAKKKTNKLNTVQEGWLWADASYYSGQIDVAEIVMAAHQGIDKIWEK